MKIPIHGKIYDLTHFANKHPGGSQILQLCRDEPDCSALFESYHAFCDLSKIENIMKKYETGEIADSLFNLADGGFYQRLKQKVRTHLEMCNNSYNTIRIKSKADKSWLITSTLSVTIFLLSQYQMFFQPSLWLRVFFSVLSGTSLISASYNLLHDGSHYAICTNVYVNQMCSEIFQTLLFWNHILWSYHHCIRHHQYTGSEEYDPDYRKEYHILKTKQKPTLIDHIKIIMTWVMPGIAVGQTISYVIWHFKGYLWNMKIPSIYYINYIQRLCFSCLFLFAHLFFTYDYGILCFFIHISSTSLFYWIGSAPDHDLYETHLEINKINNKLINDKFASDSTGCILKVSDWGELQVRSSSNFINSSDKYGIFTRILGGINYQIEHHLFPTLNNHHLKKISPIVKEMCKEYNIPYNCVENPVNIYLSLVKTYTGYKHDSIN